jgi:LysM repeat protein
LRYNDLTRDSSLRAGQVIYIQAKRGKAEKKYPAHMVRKGENLHAIAQLYGIKLRKLARRNNMKRDEKLVVGSQLILR